MFAGHLDLDHPLVWRVSELFDQVTCDELIQLANRQTWLTGTVNSTQGRTVKENLRNNSLCLYKNPRLHNYLSNLIQQHVPSTLKSMEYYQLNTTLRCYRYQTGQYFHPHYDQAYDGPNHSISHLTMLIYLNDNFEGGETDFPELQQKFSPKQGSAIFFQHAILHEGCSVTSGVKYILRGDVLYK